MELTEYKPDVRSLPAASYGRKFLLLLTDNPVWTSVCCTEGGTEKRAEDDLMLMNKTSKMREIAVNNSKEKDN